MSGSSYVNQTRASESSGAMPSKVAVDGQFGRSRWWLGRPPEGWARFGSSPRCRPRPSGRGPPRPTLRSRLRSQIPRSSAAKTASSTPPAAGVTSHTVNAPSTSCRPSSKPAEARQVPMRVDLWPAQDQPIAGDGDPAIPRIEDRDESGLDRSRREDQPLPCRRAIRRHETHRSRRRDEPGSIRGPGDGFARECPVGGDRDRRTRDRIDHRDLVRQSADAIDGPHGDPPVGTPGDVDPTRHGAGRRRWVREGRPARRVGAVMSPTASQPSDDSRAPLENRKPAGNEAAGICVTSRSWPSARIAMTSRSAPAGEPAAPRTTIAWKSPLGAEATGSRRPGCPERVGRCRRGRDRMRPPSASPPARAGSRPARARPGCAVVAARHLDARVGARARRRPGPGGAPRVVRSARGGVGARSRRRRAQACRTSARMTVSSANAARRCASAVFNWVLIVFGLTSRISATVSTGRSR